MLLKRESEKTICHVLALCEIVYNEYWSNSLKKEMINVIETEIYKANKKQSVFEIVWLIFFSRYLKPGIRNFNGIIDKQISDNQFVKSIISSSQKIFQDSGIILFRKPRNVSQLLYQKNYPLLIGVRKNRINFVLLMKMAL